LVIAHNAGFDRKFAERYWAEFRDVPWACSATQVEWRDLGFDSARLGHLLAGIGMFHDAHRAVDDCRALLEVLAFQPGDQARPVLGAFPHILVCFLAFVLRKSLKMWQQRGGLGNSPRTILEELARIQSQSL
jgi:DNA polymerase III epsilon subunit-like protein